jgi:hypothetical protein
LKEYCSLNGDCLVAQQYITKSGYKLGIWVTAQRSRNEYLSADNKKRLESLKGWSWNSVDSLWEKGYTTLKNYIESHGDSRVSAKYITEEGYKLGIWVTTQRRNKVLNKLPPERVQRLEALKGWVWSIEDIWEKGYESLLHYYKEHGDYLVPKLYKTNDGYSLGNWVDIQRRKKDSLPIKRKERLESLQGWVWNVLDSQWEIGFAHLVKYLEANRHSMIGSNFKTEDGYALGSWVAHQRDRKVGMPDHRKERLEALNGWVWSKKVEKA